MAIERAAFQLRKYSWAEDKSANGKSNYTHIVADNLYLVLQGSADVGSHLITQVVQATRVLDDIDLAYHINVANNTRRQFLQADRHVADRQLPTYAVSSGSKLAITHRKEDGRVHRMQVAFVQELDCERIISLLKLRGMTFVEPQASAGRHARSTSRPTTASTMLTRTNEATGRAFFGMQPVAAAPLVGQPLFARDERLAPREINADRPNTRDMFAMPHSMFAQHHDPRTGQHGALSNSQFVPAFIKAAQERGSPQNLEHRSESAYSDHSSTRDVSVQLNTPHTRNSLGFLTSTTSPLLNTALQASSDVAVQDPYVHLGQHTSAAQAGLAFPQLTSEALESLSAKPSNSSNPPSSRGGKRRRVTDDIEPVNDAGSDTASMPPPAARPRSSVSRSSPKTMSDLLHGKKQTQTKEANSRRPSTAQSGKSRSAAADKQIKEAGRTSHNEPSHGTEFFSLEDYAKLDPVQRDGKLQDFIFSMLGNKDFQTLCEDINASWHKLALDM